MRVFGLLLLFAGTIYCDVYSCGGFVKSSSKVDYGQLQVRLLTPEGHLKYETDVNTQNGYYMIPVYNKASYSLRVFAPNGWYFEPERYEIKVDGQTDACSKNEDINFQLIAFAIEGVVVSGDAGDGPVGLELTLSQNGKTVAKTKTTKGGAYHFKAPPGKYEVSTGADSSFCLERSNAQVEVVSGPVKVEPAIRIRGYELVVESKRGTSPLAGVEIQIFSENHPRLEKCSRLASLPAGVPSSAVHSCRLGVTGDTELRVKCLPPGRYYVTANYELNGVEYSFEPNVKTLDMGAAAAKIAFSVSKFSAKARVTVAGRAFPGVTVLLEDKPAGKTDQDGYVRLYGLKEGPVKITAQAERTFFSTVQDKLALPNINIPSVVVLGFDVCGSVEKGPHSERATLHLKNKKGGDSFTIRVQNDGSFCKLAPPALYSLEPSDGDSALAPRSIEVDLTNGPKTGYRFTHFKADVSAKASCIGPCEGVSISLLNSDGREVAKKQSSNAVFEGISPGKYNLLVEDGGRLCWESSTLPVSFEHAAPETVTFVQSGFNLRLKLSHPAEIKWVHSEKKQLQGTLAGTPGVQSICLPSEGRYTFSPSACHTFADARFDISVPYSGDAIRVQAVEAKISVRVEGGDAGVKLLVKSASGEREVSATSGGIFTWNQAVSSAGPLTLVPKSSLFLFDPTSRTVNFVGTCIDEAAIFKAEKGIFIDGEIRPAVADVAIRAVFNADENVRIEISSDENGKFRIGPLRKADDVRIEAEKEGYAFSKGDKPGLLNSVRLSQLQVTVVEVIGEDGKQGEKLGGVLLSVVGGGQGGAQTYRTNSIVDETGKINFVGLAPGEYFLRPILQEFRFEPSTTTITIREGEIEAVTMKARRYAYSAFGRVRQLSGAASKGTTVEAFSEACAQSQEEAVTDDEGNFRVRALKPDCTYRISVKAAAHTYPSHYEVDMTAEHVNKLHFVLTPIEERTEVGGEVVWERKGDVPPPATYRVRLLRREDVLETLILESPTRLFYLTNLSKDGSEYRIRIEPTSNSPSLSFAPVEEVITADASWKSLRLIVTWPPRRGADVEISRGSLLAPPFFALLALIFFNQNRALELLKSFVLRLERPSSPAPPQDAARKKRKVA